MLNVKEIKQATGYLEKEILPLIKKLLKQKNSQGFIASSLNDRNLLQPNGRPWKAYSISRLLKANA